MPLPLFSRAQDDATWSLKHVPRPWPTDRQPIVDFVREHTDPDGTVSDALLLPDEDWLPSMRDIKFVPGLFDSMMLSHEDEKGALEQANSILVTLRDLLGRASARSLQRFHEAVVRERLSEVMGILAELFEEERWRKPDRLRAVGRMLVKESPERDLVKLGLLFIVIAGPEPGDDELALAVGRHGEFTKYAVPVVHRRAQGWEQFIWNMAKGMPGYGRSDAIGYLEGVDDPEIRLWLLNEGWRESDYNESAAYVCATTGGLEEALANNTISLEAAGGLLQALCRAGIMESNGWKGLRELPNGPTIVTGYVERLRIQDRELWQYSIARSLRLFAESRLGKWDDRPAPGWTPEVRRNILRTCDEVLEFDGWEAMARDGLRTTNSTTHREAWSVAHSLRLDLWEYWWERALAEPDFEEWEDLSHHLDNERIGAFVDLAVERLEHSASLRAKRGLQRSSYALGRFPGRGWPLLNAALQSEESNPPMFAMRVLARWGRDHWTEEIRAAMRSAADRASSPRRREHFIEILEGRFVEPANLLDGDDGDEDEWDDD